MESKQHTDLYSAKQNGTAKSSINQQNVNCPFQRRILQHYFQTGHDGTIVDGDQQNSSFERHAVSSVCCRWLQYDRYAQRAKDNSSCWPVTKYVEYDDWSPAALSFNKAHVYLFHIFYRWENKANVEMQQKKFSVSAVSYHGALPRFEL